MASSSLTTRQCQWRHFFKFCQLYQQVPLPASLDTVLLYLTFMAESFKYVSIINYLSALWVLHKLNGYPHVDPKSFEIYITLRGIRRTIGDVSTQARPLTLVDLLSLYRSLDLSSSEDLALWVAILLCFRGLLRKSNVVEEGLALTRDGVFFFDWGVLIKLIRTKTIAFRGLPLITYAFFPHF